MSYLRHTLYLSAVPHVGSECLKSISMPQNSISKCAAARVPVLSVHPLLRLFLYLIQRPRVEVHLT